MDDRTLLERAAKAAGLRINFHPTASYQWNPLTNDGDALRLMVKLRLCVEVVNGCTNIGNVTWIENEDEGEVDGVIHGDDPYAATRRAIVRAAAEIGGGVMRKRDIRQARKQAEQQQWRDPYDDEQTGDASDGCGDGDEDEQEQ